MHTIIGYEVHDRSTGAVRKYQASQHKRARAYADKRDNEYGAVVCSVRLVLAPDGEPCAYEYSIKDAVERDAIARREYGAGRAVFSRI